MAVGDWDWRPMTRDDVEWLVGLKARAMQAELEQIGRWDPSRARQRLLDELVVGATWVVRIDELAVGSIALVPGAPTSWLQHFYVEPGLQGNGLGSAVLGRLLGTAPESTIRLLAVKTSRAVRLYERHGFVRERDHENGVDVVMVRDMPRRGV
ncbi:MAG TPA: GNAT family N-acetyltransferase [Mycobacteriales bacterium]|nr:GNAT family N-acetyltransferase [Mycobacteriales bacterium]